MAGANLGLLPGDAATILLPVTYDFTPQRTLGNLDIAPYLGVSLAINTGTDNRVGALLTTGLDIPLSLNFTANVAANLAFLPKGRRKAPCFSYGDIRRVSAANNQCILIYHNTEK